MRRLLSRLAPWLLGVAIPPLLVVGVVQGNRLATGESDPVPPRHPSVGPSGPGRVEVSSAAARAELCQRPPLPKPRKSTAGLPASLAPVAREVERIRGLRFTDPVHPDAITQPELTRRIRRSIDRTFPVEMMGRRTRVWRAMGVIAPDADIRQQVLQFSASGVIGFYDTASHELVFVGTNHPTPFQRVTLAHELTHALDDQHYDLGRLDQLEAACADDQLLASVSLAEGDARLTEAAYTEGLSPSEYAEYQRESTEGLPPPAAFSPFLLNLLLFPYPNGQAFAAAEVGSGGYPTLNRAFESPPVSTEQVLHPETYPSDTPIQVDVPDLAARLEPGWSDLDVYDVGEAWLRFALELRLPTAQADQAAAGWDGGEYRAWSNGGKVLVTLVTAWDSSGEAAQFTRSMNQWLSRTATGEVTRLVRRGPRVTVLWAPDAGTLERALRG